MDATRKIILAFVLALIVGGIFYFESIRVDRPTLGKEGAVMIVPRCEASGNCPQITPQPTPSVIPTVIPGEQSPQGQIAVSHKSKKYDLAREITTPDAFINTNSQPITIQELIGKKVILIDFWTYSCINCQRTTPYLNAWYEKYRDEGLEIIGIHTPEFEFEKKYENVLKAVTDEKIKYPVVMDNDFSTWGAYGNRFWPRKYLIDIDGYVVYDHIGEGAYEETEAKIQELLRERKVALGEGGDVTTSITKENPDFRVAAQSPETYFGAWRNSNLYNGKANAKGSFTFSDPGMYVAHKLYLDGSWNIESEYAENERGGAKIIFKYQAKNVFFVASSEKGVLVDVFIDGKPIQASLRGEDISPDGTVFIKNDGLYKLISDESVGEHILELRIRDAGLKAFTFTFG